MTYITHAVQSLLEGAPIASVVQSLFEGKEERAEEVKRMQRDLFAMLELADRDKKLGKWFRNFLTKEDLTPEDVSEEYFVPLFVVKAWRRGKIESKHRGALINLMKRFKSSYGSY